MKSIFLTAIFLYLGKNLFLYYYSLKKTCLSKRENAQI